MEKVIGIDLGTTYCGVSTIDENGKPVIVPNSNGESLTPSVIYFESADTYVIGSEAKEEKQAFGDENVASFFKRSMGDKNFIQTYRGKDFTPTELSAILIEKLKTDAELELGCKIKKAVITIPAYFNDFQRVETINAANTAGLEVLSLLHEPTAAAIAYGINQDKDQRILVYDLGGGTFDITILDIVNGAINAIATDGNHELGGKDWDSRLLIYIGEQFKDEFGVDPLEDMESFNELLVKAERAKKELSTRKTTKVSIVYQGQKGRYEISREVFERITKDLLESTSIKAEDVLSSAKLKWASLDGVLLVGGSTKMPMVSEWVERLSGKKPLTGVNVDEAVCLGAAVKAAMDLQDKGVQSYTLAGKQVSIKDVIAHSLGLITENKSRSKYINSFIIPKNSTIPISIKKPFQIMTGPNRNNTLEVYLTQGESERIGECVIIGKYIFEHIEFVSGNKSIIDISYQYDKNGAVQIAATQKETGRSMSPTKVDLPVDMSWVDNPPPPLEVSKSYQSPMDIVFAIDLSGSMSGSPLKEAKIAAKSFIDQLDFNSTRVALLPFADKCYVNRKLSNNANDLVNGIDEWKIAMNGIGGGNRTHPFDEAYNLLKDQKGRKFIIVLADGAWSNQSLAIKQSKLCASNNIEIIAIGFGGANKKFLKDISTSDENALFTSIDNLVSSFSTIAQVLSSDDQSDIKGVFGFLK